MASDLGRSWNNTIKTDATAAIGITRRRGLGKIRHLATADLWVQDHLRSGDFRLQKVCGKENMADILTKHVDRPTLMKHVSALGLTFEDGRPSLAPTI